MGQTSGRVKGYTVLLRTRKVGKRQLNSPLPWETKEREGQQVKLILGPLFGSGRSVPEPDFRKCSQVTLVRPRHLPLTR